MANLRDMLQNSLKKKQPPTNRPKGRTFQPVEQPAQLNNPQRRYDNPSKKPEVQAFRTPTRTFSGGNNIDPRSNYTVDKSPEVSPFRNVERRFSGENTYEQQGINPASSLFERMSEKVLQPKNTRAGILPKFSETQQKVNTSASSSSGLDLENEKAYLKDLVKNGTAGQQAWARSQAGKLGVELADIPTSDGYQSEDKYNTGQVELDKFKTELSTIEDLATKYGFDYSRDYAKTQAETLAQQKRDDIATSKKGVQNNVVSAAEGLDHDYFQQYMNQAQGQTNSGMNAGIAADQDLRLSMARQANMGDIYRDANLANFELDQALGRVNQESLAYEEQLYNERLQQAFQNVLAEGSFNQQDNLARLDAALQQRAQNIGMQQFDDNLAIEEGRLTGSYLPNGAEDLIQGVLDAKQAWGEATTDAGRNAAHELANKLRAQLSGMGVDTSMIGADGKTVPLDKLREQVSTMGSQTLDSQRLDQEMAQFNKQLSQDREQFNKQFGLDKYKFDNLSAYQREQVGLEQERNELARDQFNTEFNNLSAYQQEQIKLQQEAHKLARDQFNKEYTDLTAYQKSQVALEKARNDLAREQFNTEFNNLSAYQKSQINQQQDELNQRAHEFEASMLFDSGGQVPSGGNLDASNFLLP